MLKLIGTDIDRYYAWDLEPGVYTVGRKSSTSQCDFLISDMTVSRRHAKLEVSPDGKRCLLTDLGSHNGTFINGERITTPSEIWGDDHIQFGSADFKLIDDAKGMMPLSRPTHTKLADYDLEESVLLSMDEVLKPLPSQVTDLPEFLPKLSEIAKMLILPEPKQTMLERSLQLVSALIPADRLAILFTSEDQTETYTAALHLPEGKDPGTFTLSQTIIRKMLANKANILIEDAKADPRFDKQESIILSNMKSAMAVPLFDEDKVLGILYADTTSRAHLFNEDYLRLFALIGNIIASRLVNYTLLQERREKEIYEAELQQASTIQKKLLPQILPQVPGYSIHAFQEQCRAVGGDLYDMALLPDGRLLLLVADVSGKGMGAALLMSIILASFRILYNDRRFNLLEAVTQVSRELFGHSASHDFATLFIGVLDSRTHTMTYLNAGHNPPLLIRCDGHMEHLEPSGTMIGIFKDAGWCEDQADLNPGDCVIIFTDGVTEAIKDDEFYSDERLEKVVLGCRQCQPREIGCVIIDDVEDFICHAAHSDDITMLIIKRDE